MFFAVSVRFFQMHVKSVRQSDQQSHCPDTNDHAQANIDLHTRMKRVYDHHESVDRDTGQRQCTDINADTLSIRHQVAEDSTEYPTAEKRIQRRKRNRQHAKQYVAQRQIRDEQIRYGLHLTISCHDEAHQRITEHTQYKNISVKNVKY